MKHNGNKYRMMYIKVNEYRGKILGKNFYPQFISKSFMSLRNIIFVELKLHVNVYFRKLTNTLV